MTQYFVYDVFTDRPFGGNPLAVIPDAGTLSGTDMQRIAREFNFSETTFVFPPDDPTADFRVRIFTPVQEIPFAGHPTIGTAIVLSELGHGSKLVLELGVGPIQCDVAAGHAKFETRVPLQTWDKITAGTVAESISQPESVIRTDRHKPIIASVGLPFALAELESRSALADASTNVDTFNAFNENWPDSSGYNLLVYVRDGDDIEARMFALLNGIPEDPATGSAAAALATYLGQLECISKTFTISQGVDMGRPSIISAAVEVEDGETKAISISGAAVKVMEGELVI